MFQAQYFPRCPQSLREFPTSTDKSDYLRTITHLRSWVLSIYSISQPGLVFDPASALISFELTQGHDLDGFDPVDPFS
jgi:hypothetical protein